MAATPVNVQRIDAPQGFYPVTLKAPVTAVLSPGEDWSTTLPISGSASAAWVSLTAQTATRVTSGDLSFSIEKKAPTVLLLPVRRRVLSLSATTPVSLSVQWMGVLDQSGGGFTSISETSAVFEKTLSPQVVVELPFNGSREPTWYTLQVSSVETAGQLSLSACDGNGSLPTAWELTPKLPLHQVVLISGARTCLSATVGALVRLKPLARFDRYSPLRWQRVAPTDVLNTKTGVGGWVGRPNPLQPLRASITGLPPTAKAVVLHVSADRGTEPGSVEVRSCEGSETTTISRDGAPHAVVLPLDKGLCLIPSERFDLQATLIAVLESPEGPFRCPTEAQEPRCTTGTQLQRLQCLSGVQAVPVAGSQPEGAQQFELTLEQPVNHFQPEGAKFRQRVRLYWVDDAAPTVLHTTGYGMMDFRSELSSLFRANELVVEHRFFGPSTPTPADWTQLNIVQSAFDSHRIVEQLRYLLKGTWIGTGHSKGGMTAIFHRRFFPCDVDASAPYVAPISFQIADPRYAVFTQTVGGPALSACREAFFNADRYVIRNIDSYARRLPGSYTKVGSPQTALYSTVGSQMWSFFQYDDADDPNTGCPAYQNRAATTNGLNELANNVLRVAQGASDQYFAHEGPGSEFFGYSYQTVGELGNQDMGRQHVANLGPLPPRAPIEQLSFGTVPVPDFDRQAMEDIRDWVHQHSERLLFIYGERDPWTGGALELGNSQDSLRLIAPKANHGASISQLSSGDREQALQSLERWLKSPRKPQNARLTDSATPNAAPFIEFRDRMRVYGL